MNNKRPLVTLTYAQSLDGSIAAQQGKALRLSGERSMRMTHQLRAEHDCILIGVGTLLSDNPSLTVRLVEGKNPQPIVLDSHLRSSAESKIIKKGAWIFTTPSASKAREESLVDAGAQVIRLQENADGQVDLSALLDWLGIRVRAAMLAKASPEREEEIRAALDRLTEPDQMGTLFKTLALSGDDIEPPGFSEELGA